VREIATTVTGGAGTEFAQEFAKTITQGAGRRCLSLTVAVGHRDLVHVSQQRRNQRVARRSHDPAAASSGHLAGALLLVAEQRFGLPVLDATG